MPDRFGSNESTYDALRATTLGANVTPVGNGDATYLRLDASNDPVTGALDVKVDSTNALRVLTSGGAEVVGVDTTNSILRVANRLDFVADNSLQVTSGDQDSNAQYIQFKPTTTNKAGVLRVYPSGTPTLFGSSFEFLSTDSKHRMIFVSLASAGVPTKNVISSDSNIAQAAEVPLVFRVGKSDWTGLSDILALSSTSVTEQLSNPPRGIVEVIINSATSGRTGTQLHFLQAGLADWVIGQPPNVDAFAFYSGRSQVADGTEVARISNAGVITGASYVGLTSDSITNAKTTLTTLTHNSSGTPAANFGLRQLYQLKSSTTTSQEAGAFDVIWTDATHATRTSKLVLSNVISGVETQMLSLSAANQLTLNSYTLTLSNNATVSGSNTGDQTISLTGDVTGSGTGSFAATLATVNSNVGTFGDATNIAQVTVNAKGLVTAVSNVAISGVPAAAHDILSTTHGDTLAGAVARGSLIVGNATPKWSALALGAANKILQSDGTDVAWSTNTLSIAGNSTINGSLVGSMTGSGTVATGGFTLTIPATGTAALGTGATNYLTRWAGTNTVTGSANATLDASGNMTLATSLAIGAAASSSGSIRLQNNDGIYWRNVANTGDVFGFRLSNLNIFLMGNGAIQTTSTGGAGTLYVIGGNGKVGIGVGTSPAAKLDILNNADQVGLLVTGNSTQATATALTQLTRNDASAGVSSILALTGLGSGATGDGTSIDWYQKSSTTAAQQTAKISALWTDATHATRKAKLQLSAYDTAQRIGLEILASGTLPQIQLLGETVGNDAGDTTSDLRWETDTEANMLLVDASADKVLIGGTTNGLEISKGGTLKALGTATWFDDVRVEPTVRGSGSKVPSYTAWTPAGGSASGLYFYLFDNAIAANEKEVNFKLQMPHGKLLASAIHLHIHWMPTSTGSAGQKVRWGLEYSKANPNGVFAAPGAFIYATDPVSPPSSTPTQDTHYITEFADIDMTGDALSTILLCRLFRNSSDAADTFAGDAGLLYIDCHVEFSQLGSNEEYTQ